MTISRGSVRDKGAGKSCGQAEVPQVRPNDAQDGGVTVPQGVPVNSIAAMETCPKLIELELPRPIPLKTSTVAQQRAATRIAASLDYMMANLDKPVRVSTLSALSGFSPSSFFAFFKCATGDTPLNWFIKIRMQWAGELLRKSNLQIKDIAGQVGYEDPFYFSRLFKCVHGIAPRMYRVYWQESASRLVEERKSASNS
jgi:transcriptional regulator GlxA family with amidase domain